MNRWREDTPYVFKPPRYSRVWAPLVYLISDQLYLHRRNRIAGVKVVSGGDAIEERFRAGDALLVTPNHSDHADPHVLLHLSRRFRIPFHFMAAREIFEKKAGLHGSVLQRAGVFSVDREGSDLKAVKEAMRIIAEGNFPLVLFPEGEIFHLNSRLTPLNEGAATIALRAARKAVKDGSTRRVFIVPTAIKYSYIDDISSTFPDRMARLEQHILWQPQDQLDVVSRVYKFGEAVLALKEKEHLDRTLQGPLDQRLEEFRETLIREEEERYFSAASEGNHPTRVRRLRGRIRKILLDAEKPTPDVLRSCYRSLDRIYLAVQLYSYPGQYLRTKPHMDRVAETIHKFEEDVFQENTIKGDRSVEVTFCAPLDVTGELDAFAADSSGTVTDVTTRVEAAIRDVLE